MLLELIPKTLGTQRLVVPLSTTGSVESELAFEFLCVGPTLIVASEDSRFSAKTMSISFGEIPVIQNHQIPLHLTNDSPIHTKLQITAESPDSCFSVSATCL